MYSSPRKCGNDFNYYGMRAILVYFMTDALDVQ